MPTLPRLLGIQYQEDQLNGLNMTERFKAPEEASSSSLFEEIEGKKKRRKLAQLDKRFMKELHTENQYLKDTIKALNQLATELMKVFVKENKHSRQHNM